MILQLRPERQVKSYQVEAQKTRVFLATLFISTILCAEFCSSSLLFAKIVASSDSWSWNKESSIHSSMDSNEKGNKIRSNSKRRHRRRTRLALWGTSPRSGTVSRLLAFYHITLRTSLLSEQLAMFPWTMIFLLVFLLKCVV